MRLLKNITVVLLGCLLGILPGKYSVRTFSESHASLSFHGKTSSEGGKQDDYHFSDAEWIPFEAATRPINSVKMPTRAQTLDFSFHNFFKNYWRRFSDRSESVIKHFLRLNEFDDNSSHFCFPCRYHVLALRELII